MPLARRNDDTGSAPNRRAVAVHRQRRRLGGEKTRQLKAGQHETGRHQCDVAGERVPKERAASPPKVERDQHQTEREQLADLDADVERNHIRDEPVSRQREILQLRCETEAMEEPEEQYGRFRARLEAKTAEAADVLERLVDD